MQDWYDSARKHIKSVLPGNKHTAAGTLLSDWFKAVAPGSAAGLPAATTTVAGAVKKAATVANATDATSVITQLNLLLTNLRAAGTIV